MKYVSQLSIRGDFRRTLYTKIHGGGDEYPESISGELVTVAENLAAGADARTEYRGTKWTIRNVGDETISGGTRAKVVKVDGLTLHVEAE